MSDLLKKLYGEIEKLYSENDPILFHGWHHIYFVYQKAGVFSDDLSADRDLTQAAALVHDLNYLMERGKNSDPAIAANFRKELLGRIGFSLKTIQEIENIITTGSLRDRAENPDISVEAQALSDADTLFKCLPTTPTLFSSRYIEQNNYNIQKLADQIVHYQKPLIDEGIYFYSEKAKSLYSDWAVINIKLWEEVNKSFDDPDIVKMLQLAGFNVGD